MAGESLNSSSPCLDPFKLLCNPKCAKSFCKNSGGAERMKEAWSGSLMCAPQRDAQAEEGTCISSLLLLLTENMEMCFFNRDINILIYFI